MKVWKWILGWLGALRACKWTPTVGRSIKRANSEKRPHLNWPSRSSHPTNKTNKTKKMKWKKMKTNLFLSPFSFRSLKWMKSRKDTHFFHLCYSIIEMPPYWYSDHHHHSHLVEEIDNRVMKMKTKIKYMIASEIKKIK